MKNTDIKVLRGIGHKLDPIITIGANGITDPLVQETLRALADHELIKVKIPAGDGETRRSMGDELAAATDSLAVHRIGRMVLLYKPNPEPNDKLSNLARFGY